ncbi:DNA-3-methyladenine glycosylase family protein [Streptomyces sp. NPDC056160]|uniref:DNA-3-methyladenine glycosylase family protein n=1 Tax=Streptomyces sp. NPDC056160 TaxID=3345731 RepID=UPI0035DAFF03
MSAVVLAPRGPFSLEAGLRFLRGFTPAAYRGGQDPVLRLAFASDDGRFTVTAAVRQERTPGDNGAVRAQITLRPAGLGPRHLPAPPAAGAAEAEKAAESVARVLSLDVDGDRFPELASADPVAAGLMRRFPGLRPVCFNSPYEAAVWAVIGHRVRKSHAAAVKTLLAQRHGRRVEVAGQEMFAFPSPAALRAVTSFPGLTEVKISRLHAVAEAADAGELDAASLRALPAQDALAALRELPGIGPFSAELILIRGAGHPDVFPRHEPRLHAAMTDAYALEAPAGGVPALADIAERWKPYRSWIAFLLRVQADPRIRSTRGR